MEILGNFVQLTMKLRSFRFKLAAKNIQWKLFFEIEIKKSLKKIKIFKILFEKKNKKFGKNFKINLEFFNVLSTKFEA